LALRLAITLYRYYNSAMNGFSLATPEQVSQTLADRVKALRLIGGAIEECLARVNQ